MHKEIIIIVVVIVLIVGLDIITNNYTRESVQVMSEELNILKEYILQKSQEKAIYKMEQINKEWKERYNVLAFYIEHDELEKVETEMVGLAADIDVEEYENCINQLNTTIFILEHIQEKEEFHLRSIF